MPPIEDPLGVGTVEAPTESPEDKAQREAAELLAAEKKAKVDANIAWAETTNVWLGDFDLGSEDFEWEGTRVQIPKPPDLRFSLSGGRLTVDPIDEAAYRTWAVDYLGYDLAAGIDFSTITAGMQIQHWWWAKRLAFKEATGHYPDFTPPHVHAPGGRTRASLG